MPPAWRIEWESDDHIFVCWRSGNSAKTDGKRKTKGANGIDNIALGVAGGMTVGCLCLVKENNIITNNGKDIIKSQST